MKNEQKEVGTNDQSSCAAVSAQIREENIVQMPHSKSLKDMTAQQKKMDASKPIYLVRYE
jgi:hypothetical protein